MKTKNLCVSFAIIILPFYAFAGGDPDFVKFPEGYKTSDTHYATVNRVNGKHVASLYANKIAAESINSGDSLAAGSRIIMEVYKIKKGEDGKPVMAADGVFEKGKFAAVAVMEKRNEWADEFPAEHRAGNWGFAIYKPGGNAKTNELDCAGCHRPLKETDYIFTYDNLKK